MVSRKRKSTKKKKSSGAATVLLGILLVAVLAAAAAAWLMLVPYGPESETFVDVAPGSSALHIGQQLEAAGVIRSQFAFDLLRFLRRGTLRAGEYRFDEPAPLIVVYDRLVRGDVYTVALTVPEGANIFDIATRAEQDGFCTRQEFLEAAVEQTGLVADLDPEAKSLEGYLFPDTYRFARHTSADRIVATMVRRFRAEAEQLGLVENVHEVVTLASLIGRETAVDAERPLVASVFVNRLAKKMPLMTDPAVIYGLELEGRWRGVIYRSDLTYDTAYNTYLHSGLPPGPIDNPGLASLRAAMHPARTDYLYFVAAGDNPQGHSLFSSTLDQQSRNVAGYRHVLKAKGER